MEGLITCVLGLGAYFLIVDFPELAASSWKFLNERETAFVVARIQHDRHDAIPTTFSAGAYLKNALDLKVWGFAFIFGLCTTVSYAIAYFLPIILVRGMGFSVAAGQCLVAPPYACAAIAMYLLAVAGDKYRIRGGVVVFNAVLGLIGLPLLGYSKNNAVRYCKNPLAISFSRSFRGSFCSSLTTPQQPLSSRSTPLPWKNTMLTD